MEERGHDTVVRKSEVVGDKEAEENDGEPPRQAKPVELHDVGGELGTE